MREIKFRAKKTENGKWVYGYYHKLNESFENKDCILEHHRNTSTIIDIDTLGQYTGLKDKNGTKIFEGDIFGDSSRREIDVVVFEDGCFQLKSYYYAECCLDGSAYEDRWSDWGIEPLCNFNLEHDEILGNIYDNPELLEKVEG